MKLSWAKRIDGRYFLFGSHLTLVAIAYFFYELPRTPMQIGFAYFVAVAVELILHFTMRKYPNAKVVDRVLSALAEAAGVVLLIHSHSWYMHGITAALAVSSKYFLTRYDGAHIFNPTNFGIIAALCLFPSSYFNVFSDEYSTHAYPIMHVVAFGIFAVWYGRTYLVTLSYLGSLMMVGGFHRMFYKYGFAGTVYPEIGTFGMIFAFLMITDPKTTPRRAWTKVVYAVSIMGLMLTLRNYEVCYPNFIALFVVSLVRHILTLRKAERKPVLVERSLVFNKAAMGEGAAAA